MKIVRSLLAIILFSGTLFAQDTAKVKEFKPSGKFSGQVFADLQYKTHTPDSSNLQQGATYYSLKNNYYSSYSSFDIRRIYLGYDYNFSEKFTAQLLLAHEGNNFDAQGNRSILIKLANIRWKDIFKGTDLVFGQQSTPTFVFNSEQAWGYRSIEKTLVDMRGVTRSSDLGIGLQGKYLDGKVGYNLLVANNSGFVPENDNYKKFYGDVFGKFLDKKLIIDLNADYEINSLSPNGPNYKHSLRNKMNTKLMVAYQSKPITIGLEVYTGWWGNWAYVKDTASVNPDINKTDTVTVMPFGISIFARAPIIKEKLGVFVRYDMYDPNKNYSSALKYTGFTTGHISESFISFGFDYTPIANLHIMPNVWINSYNEKADIKNFRLYPNKGKGQGASSNDMDIRLTLFWKF